MNSDGILSIVKTVMKTINDGIPVDQTEDNQSNRFVSRGIRAQLNELSENLKKNVRKIYSNYTFN